MKKILVIVVLGLLLSGNAYAEVITLHKCRDSRDKKMDPKLEKNYFVIDLKDKKLTAVSVYTDKHYLQMQKKSEEYPELKDTFLVKKSLVTEDVIYYADENIVKARAIETFKDGIKAHTERDVDLKTFKVYLTMNITSIYNSDVNHHVQSQTQCNLKK